MTRGSTTFRRRMKLDFIDSSCEHGLSIPALLSAFCQRHTMIVTALPNFVAIFLWIRPVLSERCIASSVSAFVGLPVRAPPANLEHFRAIRYVENQRAEVT